MSVRRLLSAGWRQLALRKEQVRRQTPEPILHGGGPTAVAQQCPGKQTLGDMHPELAIGLELLFVEELVERALVRKVRIERAIALDQLELVSGDGQLQVQDETHAGWLVLRLWIM